MAGQAVADILEGESLHFKKLGDYRSIAGAANMASIQLMSNEACAFASSASSVTWDLDAVLQTINPIFTAGINHHLFHGFSYLSAPIALWPGFAAFSPYSGNIGYAESWAPRTLLWNHANEITSYIACMHLLLKYGKPQYDVAFFEQKSYVGAGCNSSWFADSGTVVPDNQYPSSQLINYYRIYEDLDDFLFVAASPATFAVPTKTKVVDVEVDVVLPRRTKNQIPILIDLWTGQMTPISVYTELSPGHIKLHISLEIYQATMITPVPLIVIPIHAINTTTPDIPVASVVFTSEPTNQEPILANSAPISLPPHAFDKSQQTKNSNPGH
ncbi:uncharacterized protein BCR38DRAFT_523382 [Pseudomassariella vexata]|uniref:Uncharacterized protein n=1 Tax=Pseudomassariella vexata TaxID=1141098 RepID=A0A1Y2DZT4_9PEZI|nr:uncharacterized protein BCR38DRAFT_523382 [Pseudomassariella vexata]ORY64798.1 hypothetical protein BCR38DRAFT_523382 [Pseudomassariella vexata]